MYDYAKNTKVKDTIIRQLYYPFRQWQSVTEKAVVPVFFERDNDDVVHLRQFKFDDVEDYNSITLPVGDLENPDYLELLEGAIDHEVGHLRWTDRTWTAKSYEKGVFLKYQ